MTDDWRFHPARHCRGSTLMWPEDSHGVILAKAICMPPGGEPCPVLLECRQWALDNHEIHGVLGGLSQRERHRLNKNDMPNEPIEHGTDAGYMRHWRRHERPCDDCRAAHSRAKYDQRKVSA